MTRKKLGMTTVVDEAGELIGIFTDGDVRRAFDNNADIHQTIITMSCRKIPKPLRATYWLLKLTNYGNVQNHFVSRRR